MPNQDEKEVPKRESHTDLLTAEMLTSYQVIANRRLGYDTLMWQTPMLGLTAQAFLFSSALSPGGTRTARIIAMVLAFATSIISIQLMSKHRHHEYADCLTLEKFEKEHSLTLLHISPRDRDSLLQLRRPWYVRLSSYQIWLGGLALFAVAALLIIAITVVRPDLLK